MFGKCPPLRGKGRPKECWQRTKSTPSASLFSTGAPMRVMMPILATTYGESVTWKDTRKVRHPRLQRARARIGTLEYLDAVFGQSRSHGTHAEGDHVHGPTCRDRNSRRCRVRVPTRGRGRAVPAMQPGKRCSRARCQSLSLIQLPS